MKFKVEIELGNDAIMTTEDVVDLLRKVSERVRKWSDDAPEKFVPGISGILRDINGNTVGSFGAWEDPPIRLEVPKTPTEGVMGQLSLTFERPGRVQVTLLDSGHLTAYVYDGAKVIRDQDPLGVYDSAIRNTNWEA